MAQSISNILQITKLTEQSKHRNILISSKNLRNEYKKISTLHRYTQINDTPTQNKASPKIRTVEQYQRKSNSPSKSLMCNAIPQWRENGVSGDIRPSWPWKKREPSCDVLPAWAFFLIPRENYAGMDDGDKAEGGRGLYILFIALISAASLCGVLARRWQ